MTEVAPPDPSWFYSSLAQATAALVGFAGAFLLLRLQDITTRWRTAAEQLETLQRTWVSADIEISMQEFEFNEVVRAGAPTERDEYVDLALERERDAAWRSLRPLLDRQAAARMPADLSWLLGLMGALFLAGCVVPLLLLDAPEPGTKALLLSLVALLVVGAGVAMDLAARRELRSWKQTTVFPRTAINREEEMIEEAGSMSEWLSRPCRGQPERLTQTTNSTGRGAGASPHNDAPSDVNPSSGVAGRARVRCSA